MILECSRPWRAGQPFSGSPRVGRSGRFPIVQQVPFSHYRVAIFPPLSGLRYYFCNLCALPPLNICEHFASRSLDIVTRDISPPLLPITTLLPLLLQSLSRGSRKNRSWEFHCSALALRASKRNKNQIKQDKEGEQQRAEKCTFIPPHQWRCFGPRFS